MAGMDDTRPDAGPGASMVAGRSSAGYPTAGAASAGTSSAGLSNAGPADARPPTPGQGAGTEFALYPAIDVRGGRVVRLRQGDYARETRYADDPLALAEAHAAAGARWLHLVDLDAARTGGFTLAPLLRAIRARTALRVQAGGGIRDEAGLDAVLDAGAERAVLGSLAVREPARVAGWLARHGPERITVALDARRDARGIWRLPVAGWTDVGAERLDALAVRLADAGMRHLLCTDIDRDGMLSGPNLALYRAIATQLPAVALQASGGLRSAADVVAVRAAGCAGAVLGRSLLEGRLRLEDALAC